MNKYLSIITIVFLTHAVSLFAGTSQEKDPEVNPLDLTFQRLAVRRFIFSNNINLSEFVPSEIVAFKSMYPAFVISAKNELESDESFYSKLEQGKLLLDTGCGKNPVSIYMGGINPYATYEINIDSFTSTDNDIPEAGIELARLGLRDRIQVIAKLSGKEEGVFLRIFKDAQLVRETKFEESFSNSAFSIKVQLYGRSLGIFITQNGETRYTGHVLVKEHFGDILDFRKPDISKECTFNLVYNRKGKVLIGKAQSYLSSGIGQGDIRPISYEDMSPYMEDGRLWFTFSCRGLDTPQSVQGVLSLDPSVFDVRFEGMIVFDHGDGLLRNDYASHLFYDRNTKEWQAYACDFGGSAKLEGRSKTGLVTAVSSKDPRRGFSIMKASRVEPNFVEGHNEDPCIFYDKDVKKWRLLTCAFIKGNGITSRTFESDTWNGKFTPVAQPIGTNSTGTSIQKIGNKYYTLMGGQGNLRVHSYPDLSELGELKLNLQPHWPKPAGRVWASVVPLPAGYPYRYVLLTMDRPNFPGVKGQNWSYGALYFYGANPER